MRVLIVHNQYQQRGGEDSVVEAEAALLRQHGHTVLQYGRHNNELQHLGQLAAATEMMWSRRTLTDLAQLFATQTIDVLHAHNTFPLISPSAYWAAARAGVPVVQTLHNFRLLCPQAMLLRNGRVCESCLGGTPLAGVVHACYRGSRAQSAAVAGMLMLHRGLGTWAHKVDRYIALNSFCRDKFIEGGLPADRIVIKPNFVEAGPLTNGPRSGLLYVGRLSAEKGIDVLAAAARHLPAQALRVAGTGPDDAPLAAVPAMRRLGALAPPQVAVAMAQAVALVMPSLWYENFPRTLVEAFAAGLPVIASRLGALAGLVDDGNTGLHVAPGDADDLAAKMAWALAHPEQMARMGRNARHVYEQLYTPDNNHRQLLHIYGQALAARQPAGLV